MKSLLAIFALASSLFAVELLHFDSLTVAGREYKNVTVTLDDPLHVRVKHDDGVARIPVELIPADLAKRAGYDPATAEIAKVEQDRAAKSAKVEQDRAAEKRISELRFFDERKELSPLVTYQIHELDPNDEKIGKLLDSIVATQAAKGPTVKIIQTVENGAFLAKIESAGDRLYLFRSAGHRYPDGYEFRTIVEPTGELYQYVDTQGANRTISVYLATKPPSHQKWIEWIKSGKLFDATFGIAVVPCFRCNGAGSYRIPYELASSPREPCGVCDRKGKITVPQRVLIGW